MTATITNFQEYRDERDSRNARSSIINLAEDLEFKTISDIELHTRIAGIVKNPVVTRDTLIGVLEINDHFLSSTSRFRIIDAYDFIHIQKQTQERTDQFTKIYPEIELAA